MSKPIVSITSSSASKESPVTIKYLTEIISEDITKSNETNELIELLLAKLQKKSSKHKFLIQATRLKSPESIESSLNILTSFGAVWDSDRDGYVSLKVKLKGLCETKMEKDSDETQESNDKVLDEELDKEPEKQLSRKEDEKENALDTEDEIKDGEFKPELNSMDLKDDINIEKDKKDVLDTPGLENIEHDDEEITTGGNEASNDSPVSIENDIDTSMDAILVSVYWTFVD